MGGEEGLRMFILSQVLIAIVAALHLYFFYLETFLWNSPKGRKIFRMSEVQASTTASLASNQGVYNALLALGLILTFFLDRKNAFVMACYLLSFIFVVGVYGAASVNRRILFFQAIPAVIGLALVWLSH